MKPVDIKQDLAGNSYPGRGIVIGQSADGKNAVIAYFIMGRSVNSRNRVFVEEGAGIRTQAFDPAKLSDPSLVIYADLRPGACAGGEHHCHQRGSDGHHLRLSARGQDL